MTALQPITVTIQEAKRITGLSHVTIYKLMHEGRVRHTKVGRRTLVSYASLQALLGIDVQPTTVPTKSKLNSGLRQRTAAKS